MNVGFTNKIKHSNRKIRIIKYLFIIIFGIKRSCLYDNFKSKK